MANKVLIATGEGTDGQVFTSNGAGAAPTFKDAGGGGASSAVLATAAYQNLTSGWQKINFSTEVVDVGGDYSTVNKRFTVPVDGAGLFWASFKVYCSAAVTNIAIYKNGSSFSSSASIPGNNTREMGRLIDLDDSDYIEFYINSSAAIYSGDLSIFKVT